MMRCEAEWLAKTFEGFDVSELSPIVNIGSSTRHFRTVAQPFIQELVFAPIEARGVRVVHADMKAADGVDISGDFFADEVLQKLKMLRPKAVICSNMFEHVVDRDALASRLLALLPKDGLFFVTVPSSYPEHHDPIDTLYRPTPAELASQFPGQQMVHQVELIGESYREQVRQRPITMVTRHVVRFFVPFLGWHKWKRSMRKLYWLAHPYKVAAIVGRKSVT